jgi:hypothetical protein
MEILMMPVEQAQEPVPQCTRFAWANEKKRTWFITKDRKAFMPKGCRLLMVLYCTISNEPLGTKSTWPQAGDVVRDVDGITLRIERTVLGDIHS